MEAELYVMSVENKHFASGMIYTPDGIQQFNGVFDNFNDIYKIRPTFATHIVCFHDEYCINNGNESFYYLTYSNVDDLKRMITFMEGASSIYLTYIPSCVITELGIKLGSSEITFSNVNIPRREQIPCKFLGSTFTYMKVVDHSAYVNDVDVGVYIENPNELKMLANIILINYIVKYHKGFLSWSDILKMWCGIKIL